MSKKDRRRLRRAEEDPDEVEKSEVESVVSEVESVAPSEASEVTDEATDASIFTETVELLSEKRTSLRETALRDVFKYLDRNYAPELLEPIRETLITNLLNSVRKGQSTEASLALQNLSLVGITIGAGADEYYQRVAPLLQQVIKDTQSPTIKSSALNTLAMICFVCNTEELHTQSCMGVFEENFNGPAAEAALNSWALLATTVPRSYLLGDNWRSHMRAFRHLLSNEKLEVRIAAGWNLAFLYEVMRAEDFSHPFRDDEKSLVELLSAMSTEGNRRSGTKKERVQQRSVFRDILRTVEDGEAPSETIKIKKETLTFDSWSQLTQLRGLRDALGGGFQAHFQANELLRDIFGLPPPVEESGEPMTAAQKRLFCSPNSAFSKARTKEFARNRNKKSTVQNSYMADD